MQPWLFEKSPEWALLDHNVYGTWEIISGRRLKEKEGKNKHQRGDDGSWTNGEKKMSGPRVAGLLRSMFDGR